MGEVLLVWDHHNKRKVALKKIREDLIAHPHIRNRFLREARITSQLQHPGIIPIYSISISETLVYYTMPFVDGITLKELIRKGREDYKTGKHSPEYSISSWIRIFLTVCYAVDFAHAKGVLHRDLKPENIMVGKYGEVMILDWGLAKPIAASHQHTEETSIDEEELIPTNTLPQITRLGKTVGTVAYMAPERAFGKNATVESDLYALGVILYQLLALKYPFRRRSLHAFRKHVAEEVLVEPSVASPYRDIPDILSRAVKRCLKASPEERYHSVKELIHELEIFIEGRSEWMPVASLSIHQKQDWEFQEHVLLTPYKMITIVPEETNWAQLMLSARSFPGNLKITTKIRLEEHASGIGLLFNVPEESARTSVYDGYSLWIASDLQGTSSLSKGGVELLSAPEIFLRRHEWIELSFEKIDQTVHLFFDGVLQLSYTSSLSTLGTHIGILLKDTHCDLRPLEIFSGNINLTVNCLAIPDAFMAKGDLQEALSEYKRIGHSFHDRTEGREALFRAGLVLIEIGKQEHQLSERSAEAFVEFEKLHRTPAAPLEYLGKSLVYRALEEWSEEVKCFSLAYRRYPEHPLLHRLHEHLLSRMHQISQIARVPTYAFVLVALRHLPTEMIDTHTRYLFASLKKNWEPLPFLDGSPSSVPLQRRVRLAIPIAFWLNQPWVLSELFDEVVHAPFDGSTELKNISFALFALDQRELGREKWQQYETNSSLSIDPLFAALLSPSATLIAESLSDALAGREDRERIAFFLNEQILDQFLCARPSDPALPFPTLLPLATQEHSDLCMIWKALLTRDWTAATAIFEHYTADTLLSHRSPLHFLYGCLLAAIEGEEIAKIHFQEQLYNPHPRSWNLATHYLLNELPPSWFNDSFAWERRSLYRSLALYFFIVHREEDLEAAVGKMKTWNLSLPN